MERIQQLIPEPFFHPAVQAGAVILASVVAAWLAAWVLTRVLLRLARRTRTTLDDQLIQVLHRPVHVSVILMGLYMATGILDPAPMFTLIVLRILGTVALLLWTGTLLRLFSTVLAQWSRHQDRVQWLESRTLPLFDNVAKILLVGAAIYGILVIWNLDLGPWLASAGIVGIAIGFAAKDSLANVFAGLFIIADAPYRIGDFIILDTGERGRITRIGLRSTRLLTRDDIEIILPNAQIGAAKIVNESGGPHEKERVTLLVGVAYGSDVDQVRRALLEAAEPVEHVVSDPAPRVRFTEFGDSGLIFRLLCWIDEPVLRGECLDQLHTSVYKKFQAEGISIPFPQRDLHIKQMPHN